MSAKPRHEIPKTDRQTRWIALGLVLAFVAGSCGGSDSLTEDTAPTTVAPASSSDSATTAAEQSPPADADDGSAMSMMMNTIASHQWEGMRIEIATMAPTSFHLFQGADSIVVEPKPEDSFHLMAVLADEVSGERIPYADLWVTILDSNDQIVFDERLWPMLSRAMGTHYGINVAMPSAGSYTIDVQLGPPQGARHPEYSDRWLSATTVTATLDWAP